MTCTSVFAVGKCARTTSNQFAASIGNQPRWLPQPTQRSSAACPWPACMTAKLVQHPFLKSAFRSSLKRSPCSGDASASSDRHCCFTASLVVGYGNPADVAASAFLACIHTSAFARSEGRRRALAPRAHTNIDRPMSQQTSAQSLSNRPLRDRPSCAYARRLSRCAATTCLP
jgi:hypothetical protein